jgi:hypothetical protein
MMFMDRFPCLALYLGGPGHVPRCSHIPCGKGATTGHLQIWVIHVDTRLGPFTSICDM